MNSQTIPAHTQPKPKAKRRLPGALLFVLATLLLWYAVDFLLVDDVHSYTRIMLQELYGSTQNIDLLFVGPSHCYRSLDPAQADALLGKNTFNAGTSQQLPDGALYLIQEAAQDNQIETVYLEAFYATNQQQASSDIPMAAYVITDFSRPSLRKYQYLWQMGGLAAWLDDLVPARHNNISPGQIAETWRAKLTDGYQPGSYRYVTYGDEEYRGKGFVYCRPTIGPETDFTPIAQIDPQQPLSDFAREYIEKIADYCARQGMELVLFSAPLPDAYTQNVTEYDAYVQALRAMGQELGFAYWDFNLYKTGLEGLDYSRFYDAHHLNGEGAELFTQVFCQTVQARDQGRDQDLFYETYAQKRQNTHDGTVEE